MEHSHEGGAEGIEKCIFNNAFSPLSFTVEEVTTEGDRVVARFSAQGRQVAAFQGVAPSGKDVTARGVVTFRVEDGRIAEASGTLSWDS